MLLLAAMNSGVRNRDYNPELIAQLPGSADGSRDWTASSLIRYSVLLDTGKLNEAYPVLISVLEHNLEPKAREVLVRQSAWLRAELSL
jgi:hypothetical protein